jgi:hypothetical protein
MKTMKEFLDKRTLDSREELIQLIGLPKSVAYSNYKELIPIHAVVSTEPLYASSTIEQRSFERPLNVWPQPEATSISDTNLWEGRLTMPNSFAVKSLGVVFSAGSDPFDRQRFADNFAVSFWLSMRCKFRSPVAALFETESGNMFDPTRSLRSGGDLTDYPVVIPPDCKFSVLFEGEPFDLENRKLKLWVILKGLYLQGIC